MKKSKVDPWLNSIGKDRRWLARETGYTYEYVRNSLAPKAAELSFRFAKAIEETCKEYTRAQIERQVVGPNWDSVLFTGSEAVKIDQAKRAAGYESLSDLYRDAVIKYVDKLLDEIPGR